WVPVSSEVDGTNRDNDPTLQQWRLVFEGDKVSLPDQNRAPYTLNPAKQPREMDIRVKGDVSPMRAIYEFDGDRLRLSWTKRGKRPSDFDTRKNGSVLIVFKRWKAP